LQGRPHGRLEKPEILDPKPHIPGRHALGAPESRRLIYNSSMAAKRASQKKSSSKKKPAAKKQAAPKKAASKKAAPKKAAVKKAAVKKAAAKKPAVTSGQVMMGHVFSLRPRVITAFRPDDFRRAKQLLEEEPFKDLQEAARAVAEKALELTQDGPDGVPRPKRY